MGLHCSRTKRIPHSLLPLVADRNWVSEPHASFQCVALADAAVDVVVVCAGVDGGAAWGRHGSWEWICCGVGSWPDLGWG